METIHSRIKEIRTERFLNQIDFARLLGVTSAHISKIEKGKTKPSDALIKLISKEFYINEEWIKYGKGIKDFNVNEVVIDDMMIEATEITNSILNNENPLIHYLGAELELLFANIINISDIVNDEKKIKYLENLKNLFSIINEFNNNIKKYSYSSQESLPEIIKYIKLNYKKNIEHSIDSFFE